MYLIFRYRAQVFLTALLFACFTLAASPVFASCIPTEEGTPRSDAIICDLAHQPVANTISGGLGSDLIIVRQGAAPGNVTGDSTGDVVATENGGNDIITIDGSVIGSVYGDYGYAGGGNDRITINGSIHQNVFGDYASGSAGGGNDSITINGSVDGNVYGDTTAGGNGGNDIILINGVVGALGSGEGNVFGDDTSYEGGNDMIVIRGTVNANVFGDYGAGDNGADTLIISGSVHGIVNADGSNGIGGNDNVKLRAGASVDGVIDGGDGNDTLTFILPIGDIQDAQVFAQLIAGLSPSGGSVSLDGHTYTWVNFEHLAVV